MRLFFKKLPLLIAGLALLMLPLNSQAATLEQQRDAAAAAAKNARDQATAKQQEADYLNAQVKQINNQIAGIQGAINTTSGQITDTQQKIEDLKAQIKIQEDNLAKENEKMNQIVSAWYMEGDDTSITTAILSSNTLSEVVTKQEYYDSIKQQIEATIEKINQLKAELDKQKTEQDSKMVELKNLQEQQELQKAGLQSQQWVKYRLLNDTTSMISELKSRSADATRRAQQIQQQIDTLSATANWGSDIVSSGVSWYRTQTGDYTHLGYSEYTVNDSGCLVTSVAMVATYYEHPVTPSEIASQAWRFGDGFMYDYTGLGISVGGSQPVNWGTVNSQIESGKPVIVSVYLPSVGKVNGDGSSHFIVIWGKSGDKYLMADPIRPSGRSYSVSQVLSMKIVTPY